MKIDIAVTNHTYHNPHLYIYIDRGKAGSLPPSNRYLFIFSVLVIIY